LAALKTKIVDPIASIPEQFNGLFSDDRLNPMTRDKRWEAVVVLSFARILLRTQIMKQDIATRKMIFEAALKILADAPKEGSAVLQEWSLKLLDLMWKTIPRGQLATSLQP
jgi:hypothetical protein